MHMSEEVAKCTLPYYLDDVLVNRRSSIKLLHTEDGLC